MRIAIRPRQLFVEGVGLKALGFGRGLIIGHKFRQYRLVSRISQGFHRGFQTLGSAGLHDDARTEWTSSAATRFEAVTGHGDAGEVVRMTWFQRSGRFCLCCRKAQGFRAYRVLGFRLWFLALQLGRH